MHEGEAEKEIERAETMAAVAASALATRLEREGERE